MQGVSEFKGTMGRGSCPPELLQLIVFSPSLKSNQLSSCRDLALATRF
uniref:Uncharacterized protein n=1 Tax=Physcomitrium patens TaxID=3218 RepID=A0A2K1JBM5_PHYPA|nr:hypothetical protein PHYPA_019192 [Physcomitrium patens]